MKQTISRYDFISHTLKCPGDFLAKMRTKISKVFGFLIVLSICFSGSKWDELIPILGDSLFFAGSILMGIGTLGRIWCSVYIAGFKNRNLIDQGPYSMCRNPLYLFSCLGAMGVGMGTETISIPLIILFAFTMYYPHVIKNEEQKLSKRHGSEYTGYLNGTPAFFPNLSLLSEPSRYNINPIHIRKELLSAIWFIWLFGIVTMIVKMHQEEIIPMLLTLY